MYRSCLALSSVAWFACAPTEPDFPDPTDWSTRGPGGPSVPFIEADLLSHCAYLTGGPEDHEHHNLVVMHDGYLLMPWAPEDASGGITFFEFDDPCNPTKIGESYDAGMRGRGEARPYDRLDRRAPPDIGSFGTRGPVVRFLARGRVL